MRYSRRFLAPMAMAGALVFAACTDNGTNPQDVSFDAAQTSADMQAANDVLESSDWQSFQLLGDLLGSAAPMPSIGFKPTDLADLAGESITETRSNLQRLAERIYAASQASPGVSLVPIISNAMLGVTFVYDPALGRYAPDPARAGAPANGVRFIIYAVNPVTGQPVVESEVGWADFTDEGVDLVDGVSVRLQVVSGGTTFLDYTVAVNGTTGGGNVTVTGFVTDGVNTLTFDLDVTLNPNGLSFSMLLEVPERGASIEATVSLTPGEAGPDVDINVVIASGNDRISVSATGDDLGFTAEVRIGNQLLATIEQSGDGEPVITGADGRELTPQEMQALGEIVDIVEHVFDVFEGLLEPVDGLLALGILL